MIKNFVNLVYFSKFKLKPLIVSAQLKTDNNIQIHSLTSNKKINIDNALETLLASLALCQLSTLKDLTRKSDFKIISGKFIKVQSSYNIENYFKGGQINKIGDIYIQAQFQTNGTQQQLDQIHQKVKNACPVYQTLKGSGINIKAQWKNINSAL